jgi:hypothetical protein
MGAAPGPSHWSPLPSCCHPTSGKAQVHRLDPGTIQVSACRSRPRAYAAPESPAWIASRVAGWRATHYRCGCFARHTAPVISRELATRLAPYLSWTPANGDMFFIPRPEIAESVFIVSDMVVELVVSGGESRFHFNGTVEWALDSVESAGVVWLPREDQLRQMLGEYFLSLDSSAGGFVVTVSGPSKAYHTEAEPDAADAYARAALYVLRVEQPSIVS